MVFILAGKREMNTKTNLLLDKENMQKYLKFKTIKTSYFFRQLFKLSKASQEENGKHFFKTSGSKTKIVCLMLHNIALILSIKALSWYMRTKQEKICNRDR